MKKIVSILVLLSMLLGITSAFASGDEYWIYTYTGFANWMNSSSTVAGLALDTENVGPFIWPTEATTLTANVGKNLSFDPHPYLGDGKAWAVPSNITVNGVDLDYGGLVGSAEDGQLTIAGNWGGDVTASKAFTLTGSVTGDVIVRNDYLYNLTGEIDGNLGLYNATATVDLTKVKGFTAHENATLNGNLTAEYIYLADGMEGMSSDLTIQSGSAVEAKNGADGTGTITVESGATLTLWDRSYVNITVKSGGTLNLKMREGGVFDLIDANLHIEEGGLVNAYRGISIYYENESAITGSGTICFWNDEEEWLPKYGYRYMGMEDEEEYFVNDGNVPRVEPTVIFTSAVCEHINTDDEWFAEEGWHWYYCDICGRDVDGGLHRFDVTLIPNSGSSWVCSLCGYTSNKDLFWNIQGGVLSLRGTGVFPELGGYDDAPWYDDRASIKEIEISDEITFIGTGFAQCEGLTSVRLPSRLGKINSQTFYQCSNLKRVEIPAGVKFIYSYAFDGCTSLTDVYFGGTQEEWAKVKIRSYNEPLKSATVHCNSPMLSIEKEETDTQTTVTVTPSNLDVGTALLLGCYQNGVLTDLQIRTYQGVAETFTVRGPYDSLKVMAWKNTTDLQAVCISAIR